MLSIQSSKVMALTLARAETTMNSMELYWPIGIFFFCWLWLYIFFSFSYSFCKFAPDESWRRLTGGVWWLRHAIYKRKKENKSIEYFLVRLMFHQHDSDSFLQFMRRVEFLSHVNPDSCTSQTNLLDSDRPGRTAMVVVQSPTGIRAVSANVSRDREAFI